MYFNKMKCYKHFVLIYKPRHSTKTVEAKRITHILL